MVSPTVAAQDTRERLIITAERLFAERGIGEVSLREVGVAAGQRNTSAATYHFGRKKTLIEAIVEYRMRGVNEQRLHLLAAMRAEGSGSEVRSLLEAFVVPLAASTAEQDSHYARFLAQFSADPMYRTSWDWETATSLHLVWTGLHRCLSDLPRAVVEARLGMLINLVIHTVADHERIADTTEAEHPAEWVNQLVDAAEGMLTAPVASRH